jgi:hypothetical protein
MTAGHVSDTVRLNRHPRFAFPDVVPGCLVLSDHDVGSSKVVGTIVIAVATGALSATGWAMASPGRGIDAADLLVGGLCGFGVGFVFGLAILGRGPRWSRWTVGQESIEISNRHGLRPMRGTVRTSDVALVTVNATVPRRIARRDTTFIALADPSSPPSLWFFVGERPSESASSDELCEVVPAFEKFTGERLARVELDHRLIVHA